MIHPYKLYGLPDTLLARCCFIFSVVAECGEGRGGGGSSTVRCDLQERDMGQDRYQVISKWYHVNEVCPYNITVSLKKRPIFLHCNEYTYLWGDLENFGSSLRREFSLERFLFSSCNFLLSYQMIKFYSFPFTAWDNNKNKHKNSIVHFYCTVPGNVIPPLNFLRPK